MRLLTHRSVRLILFVSVISVLALAGCAPKPVLRADERPDAAKKGAMKQAGAGGHKPNWGGGGGGEPAASLPPPAAPRASL